MSIDPLLETRLRMSPTINSPEPEELPCTIRSRMVKRSSGRSLVRHRGIPPRSYLGYVKDFFTSIVNGPWYAIILVFFASYILSWLLFGTLWTILAYSYPDANMTCVVNVNDFKSAFLFSVETQTTIGFGFRYPSSGCGVGTLLIVIQSTVGLILDSFMLGIIFAKLSRPRNRRKTLIFSQCAVIHDELVKKKRVFSDSGGAGRGQEQVERVLELRIADVRRSQVVEGHVRLQLYWYRESRGGRYQLEQYDLDVGYDTGRDRVFLLTPVCVRHHISESSPLYGLTREQLASAQLELVVILEGIVEATGLTAQALWSYTRDEILFDCRFEPVMSCSGNGQWEVDFSKLNSTVEVGHGE